MRSEPEVEAMLARFRGLSHEDVDDTAAEGVHEALLWFLGDRSDDDLKVHIPEAGA